MTRIIALAGLLASGCADKGEGDSGPVEDTGGEGVSAFAPTQGTWTITALAVLEDDCNLEGYIDVGLEGSARWGWTRTAPGRSS